MNKDRLYTIVDSDKHYGGLDYAEHNFKKEIAEIHFFGDQKRVHLHPKPMPKLNISYKFSFSTLDFCTIYSFISISLGIWIDDFTYRYLNREFYFRDAKLKLNLLFSSLSIQ